MTEIEMADVVGKTLLEEFVVKGFDFDGIPSLMNFMATEAGRPINVSQLFVQPCPLPLIDCLNEDRVNALFSEVMGRYMRTRLLIVLPLLYLIAVVSIVSNVLGIRAVAGVRHTLPRHWVLINLSFSDCLLAPLNAVKVTSEVLAYSAFDEFFRTYLNSLWQVFFLLCPLSLLFLAIDNLVAVVAPFFYERHSGSRARTFVLCVGAGTWLTIILLIILLHIFDLQHSQTVQLIVATVLLVIIAITVTLYVALALKAEIYRRKLMVLAMPSTSGNIERHQRDVLRSRMKTTATTLSIVMTLAGFWSPFIAYLLVPEETKFAQVPFFIKFLCAALVLFQIGTAIDPIVYCCRMVEVRRSLFATILPPSCRERIRRLSKTPSLAGDSQLFQSQMKRQSSSFVNPGTTTIQTTTTITTTTTQRIVDPNALNGNSHKINNNLQQQIIQQSEEAAPLRQNEA